jgi:hypothetical protein
MTTKYYLIGPPPGTNLVKHEDGGIYLLNDVNEWEHDPSAIRFIMHDTETREVAVAEARDAYSRITNGKAWTP